MYQRTWNVDVVVDYLKSKLDLTISLGHFSRKLAALLALATLLRVSELASIVRESLTFSASAVSLYLPKPRKARKFCPKAPEPSN